MLETILPVLVDASLPLVSLVVSLAVAYLTKYLKSKLAAGAGLAAALEIATTAEDVVLELEQTVRPFLVQASEDGKLSKEDGEALKAIAVQFLKERLSAEAVKLVGKNQARLAGAIEAALVRVTKV